MAGPSKCTHFLVNLARPQDNAKEQYADIHSEEETKDIILQDPAPSEANYEDFEWCHKHPSDEILWKNKIG